MKNTIERTIVNDGEYGRVATRIREHSEPARLERGSYLIAMRFLAYVFQETGARKSRSRRTARLSGCLTRLGLAERGFLSYKGVSVIWRSDDRPMSADLCWVWSDGHGRIFGWVAEEYPTIAETSFSIHVPTETAAQLTSDFEGVVSKIGFSRPTSLDHDLLEGDWTIAETSRRDFNRVQFGDQAEILFRSTCPPH